MSKEPGAPGSKCCNKRLGHSFEFLRAPRVLMADTDPTLHPADHKSRAAGILLPIALAMLVSGIYAAASWSNRFVYDDHEVIENQFPARNMSDLARVFSQPHYLNFPYYRPITRCTFAIQQAIWGGNPRPYHLFNACVAGLTFLAAFGLLRMPSLGLRPAAAIIACLWFSLHPAFSECIYPAASGRETLMPALMILVSTWAYLHRGPAWYWAAISFLVLGLLCKEQAAVLPAILVLIDILDLRVDRPPRECRKRLIIRWIPILAVLAGYFWLRSRVLHSSLPAVAIAAHPLAPLLSILYGVQATVTPFVTLHYEPTFAVWFNPLLCALSLAAAILVFLLALTKKPTRKIALFWLGWFILLQLPTAHLLSQEAPYSERYVALAALGFAAIGAAVLQQIASNPKFRRLAGAAAIIWTIAFGIEGFLRAGYYAGDESFVDQWLKTNPDSAGAHDGKGFLLQQSGDLAGAARQYERALALDPNSTDAHNNLANLLADRGDYQQAARHYEWILAIDPANTNAMVTYAKMLSRNAYDQHDPAAAQLAGRAYGLLAQAIGIRPDYAQAHYVMALWQQAFGSRAAAISEYQQTLRLRPDFSEAKNKLDQLLGRKSAGSGK
jgi:tetratricopeptide (TPR) repeat protein